MDSDFTFTLLSITEATRRPAKPGADEPFASASQLAAHLCKSEKLTGIPEHQIPRKISLINVLHFYSVRVSLGDGLWGHRHTVVLGRKLFYIAG